MNYAIIENGVVGNIIVLRLANASEFPNAIAMGDRPVRIGDTYANGKFYRDGTEILTPSEEIEEYKAALMVLGVETEDSV